MAASSACVVGNGLSTHNTRTRLSKEIYGKQFIQSLRLPSLSKTSKTVIVRASVDQRPDEGRRGFLKLLLGNAGLAAPALLGNGKAFADEQGVSNSRMSYSRFLEYLDKDRVTKVDLFENGTIAIVEAISPELGNRVQRVRVQLPGLSQELLQKIVAGMEGTVMTDGKSKSLVAYHEVGHAICGTLTPGHDPVQKVTLVPRGQAHGLTWFIPTDDPTLISKQQLFARIVGGLGGRAAEEIIFGKPEVTTGAAGDLQQITSLAKQMVVTFGMSELGPWSLMDSSARSADVFMRMMARNSKSERLAEDIDSAIKTISNSAYQIVLSDIQNNRAAMDKIVEVLLEKETMSGDEFRAILSEFVEIPTENRVSPTPSPVTV
ncbi:ATP-dependent zinc metalloprotease FTSH 8 [Forsythia ovata]|uniref:ATP-dependent zinc metalloprotease FTSH 8 n=1 Tax=Forsythia ovata TaxID=205694 RepID=A0ABD1S8A4_9LAMI